VTDNGNGTYTATFTGTAAGSNTITATIGGSAVTSAAPAISVTTTDITSQTTVTHTGGSRVRTAGASHWAQSATLTNSGNTTYQGGITIEFTSLAAGTVVQGATINGVFVAAQQDSNGVYFITILAAPSSFGPGQSIGMALQFNQYPGSGYGFQVIAG
jgi:adhesin/invasin